LKVGQSAPFTVAAISAAPICGLTNDATNHVPNATTWKNFTPPRKGDTYGTTGDDTIYGCVVKRLTDSTAYGQAIHHYYATAQAMNADDTRIIVLDENMCGSTSNGHYHIIDLNGNDVVNCANMPSPFNKPSWDRTSANVWWEVARNRLLRCTINRLNSVSCVTNHTFSEYAGYQINSIDATDMTPDGWLPLVGQGVQGGTFDLFLWNPTTLTKSPIYRTSCTGDVANNQPGCLHKMISGPTEGLQLEFAGAGRSHDQGNIIWAGFTSPPWTETHYETHSNHHDSGEDLNSNPVAASEDYTDNTALCGFNPAIIKFPTTPENCPLSARNNPGWHVSYRDWPARAWVVYSAQAQNSSYASLHFNNDAGYADPTSSRWHLYDDEIVLVRVDANNDPTKIYRLALAHTRNFPGYFWDDPRAVVSWDGKYVIFDSNAAWSASGCGSITNCTDVYLIKIH
jgi:hypothetical protein